MDVENKDKQNPEQAKPEEKKDPPAPTPEELQARIKALESELVKQKAATSNASTDAADWKRKYRETLDANERAKQEQADSLENLQKELASYKQKEKTSTYTAKLIGAGYDATTAATMAAALPEGLEDTFFEGQKAFLENQKKAYEAARMGGQPPLTGGKEPTSQNPPVDTSKMTDEEYYAYRRKLKEGVKNNG